MPTQLNTNQSLQMNELALQEYLYGGPEVQSVVFVAWFTSSIRSPIR